MQSDQETIPISIARLLIGYFSHTLSETDNDQLDEWICADDDNMKVFEDCLEVTLLPLTDGR